MSIGRTHTEKKIIQFKCVVALLMAMPFFMHTDTHRERERKITTKEFLKLKWYSWKYAWVKRTDEKFKLPFHFISFHRAFRIFYIFFFKQLQFHNSFFHRRRRRRFVLQPGELNFHLQSFVCKHFAYHLNWIERRAILPTRFVCVCQTRDWIPNHFGFLHRNRRLIWLLQM